jgi:CheY-like chemotaxis protein
MAGESILIVEDNPLNLKLAVVVLELAGYVVRTAVDAAAAVVALETFRPHLILMDMHLPGMSGLELTRRLRAAPETRDVPIVALTAAAMRGDEERAHAAGCDGYLTKPIDVATFAESVASYLVGRPG